MSLELRHLRTFLAVAETQNISAAARMLRATQPALSRQIRELEHAVGASLFLRHPSGLALTPAGKVLQKKGRAAMKAFDDALRAVKAAPAPEARPVRMGYYGAPCVWATFIAPAVEALRRRHPGVDCRMIEASSVVLENAIRVGAIDVALMGPGTFAADAEVVVTAGAAPEGMLMMPANHPLAKKRSVALGELRRETILDIRDELAPGRSAALAAACQAAGFTPRLDRCASGWTELMHYVGQKRAVAVVESFAANAPHPGVVFAKLKGPCVPMVLRVAHGRAADDAARELARLLVETGRRQFPARSDAGTA